MMPQSVTSAASLFQLINSECCFELLARLRARWVLSCEDLFDLLANKKDLFDMLARKTNVLFDVPVSVSIVEIKLIYTVPVFAYSFADESASPTGHWRAAPRTAPPPDDETSWFSWVRLCWDYTCWLATSGHAHCPWKGTTRVCVVKWFSCLSWQFMFNMLSRAMPFGRFESL